MIRYVIQMWLGDCRCCRRSPGQHWRRTDEWRASLYCGSCLWGDEL